MTLSNITLSNGNTCRIFKNAIADDSIHFTVKRGKSVKHTGKWMPKNGTVINTEGLTEVEKAEIVAAIQKVK
ncbi:MAG: hypothetical protein ACK5XQ_01650 [Flavobacteriales bacterium]|jgi:hypothetical protein